MCCAQVLGHLRGTPPRSWERQRCSRRRDAPAMNSFSYSNHDQEEHEFSRTLPDLISAALPSLLLVIYCGALNLLSRGIGCVNGHRAGFAISRYHDPTGNRDLLVFLAREG